MKFLVLMLFVLVCVRTLYGHQNKTNEVEGRTFAIDWTKDTFVKDGKPFRFIAGSFHYFRAHPDTWRRKLRTMRAGGLNAVTTYVEWSLHNPKDGVYVWEGIADLEKFIKLAIGEDLLVILRPGPYICAERDMGGFPYWLLTKYPNIQLRTADLNYLHEVRIWYSQLMARMTQYLYGNGGPIIMVQVENEYGSYYACDTKYREWLRDETLGHVKDHAVLFTNDGPGVLRCGHIPEVLATMDFGATNELNSTWSKLRRIQPHGPLVNAEYYPGWLTHWSEPMARVSTTTIIKTFTDMLDVGASVNFYMYHGGTNFGFTSGSNDGGPGHFQPDITSYDYDAPMDEAGDPTEKYYAIREVIGRYLPLPNIPVPSPQPKRHYGTVHLTACCRLLSPHGRSKLSTGTVQANKPLTFEALNQNSGLVLYETKLPRLARDPAILRAVGIRDRAYVYVNGQLCGILSRETPIFQLALSGCGSHSTLQLLVENQGRINYGQINDFKGILGDVFIDRKALSNWTMTKFPLESYHDIMSLMETAPVITSVLVHQGVRSSNQSSSLLMEGPTFYVGNLFIEDSEPQDTYLDTTGWGKGVVFVNGENLGRYWPLAGPQITLYVPGEVLKSGDNQIVLLEYQSVSESTDITFTNVPNFNGLK